VQRLGVIRGRKVCVVALGCGELPDNWGCHGFNHLLGQVPTERLLGFPGCSLPGFHCVSAYAGSRISDLIKDESDTLGAYVILDTPENG
jgi:hypothetical protein